MNKHHTWALLAGLATTACSTAIEAPQFSATPDKTTYKVGERVTFTLSGNNPDNVTFYSGEPGRDYYSRDLYSLPGGVPEMQFTSAITTGATTAIGQRNLSVLVSTNFSGKYDTTSVRQATWTDITSRVTLATGTPLVSSGVVSLGAYKEGDKPLYVAFRYRSATPLATQQPAWSIRTFQYRNVFPNGRVAALASTNTDVGFATLSFKGVGNWVAGTNLDHAVVAANAPVEEDWAVSAPFDPTRVIPDKTGGLNVKASGLPDVVPATYTYTYTTAGSFKAVFLAQSGNSKTRLETTQEIPLTITP